MNWKTTTECNVRTATISKDSGERLGVCIFVSNAQLRQLGINLTECAQVEYRISLENDCLLIRGKESAVQNDDHDMS
jgi:hypothetical protein